MRSLGLAGVDNEAVLRWYADIVTSVSQLTSGAEAGPAGPAAVAELHAAVIRTVEQVPESLLAEVGRSDELTDEELVANVGVILFGAIETSEAMTANALFHLLGNPEQLQQVANDHTLIGAATEESLRLEPAAAVVDRYATRTAELGAAVIEAGDPVTVPLTAANRDPEIHTDPDSFDIFRPSSRRHLSFVQGPHICLGRRLARLETGAAVGAVLDRLQGIELDAEQSAPPSGLVFRKPPAVVARWRPVSRP